MSNNEKEGTKESASLPPIETPLIRPKKSSLSSGLRSSFIAGVVVAAPIAITVYIIYWFITKPMRRLDTFVRELLPAGDTRLEAITQAIPGFGLIVAILALVLLGAFAKNFFGRAMIRTGGKLLDQMPVVRNLYRFFKNVFETALQKSDRSFKEVVLMQYPREGLWALAFVVSEATAEIGYRLEGATGELVGVFVPTVPNPTSGFLLYVPKSDVVRLDMSVEDAAKLVFSMGLVVPEYAAPSEAVGLLKKAVEQASKDEPRTFLSRFGGKKLDA